MNILITSGGTREPIDGVRVLANASTGATGAALADAFARAGATVTLLHARASVRPHEANVRCENFLTVADLDRLCAETLAAHDVDLIIHAAAVSDFVLDALVVDGVRHTAPMAGKLDSTRGFTASFVPGKKILPHLKSYSKNKNVKLVGFKLTDGASAETVREAVEKVLAAGADLVVHNDVQHMRRLRATVWSTAGEVAKLPSQNDLEAFLLSFTGLAPVRRRA